jgi:glycosyltransferase involved in cell wall biosynthesis
MNIAQNSSFTYKWIVGPLVRLLYNKADRVVAVSEGVREALITKMKIRPNIVKTITNGFDVDEIRKQALLETDGMKKIPNNKFIYVMTGRYSYEKAHWHLIRAFAEVVRQCGDEVYLILMGKGKEEAYLRQVISENKLENFVELMPYKKNPFAVLKQCNVFIMPSMFEGYCNALCEALICGLPCIATDFRSSAREILAPDTPYENQVTDRIEYAEYGIITPVCSGTRYRGNEPLEKAEGLLAQAMISLYKDPELLKKYQDKSGIRANQLNITEKVQEWVELVKN